MAVRAGLMRFAARRPKRASGALDSIRLKAGMEAALVVFVVQDNRLTVLISSVSLMESGLL